MLCLKKRRTYSFTQGACNDIPRRSTKQKNEYNEALNVAVTTFPRKHRSREQRNSGAMVLTVTEDTPADMLAGSMELLVQLPRDHNVHTQRVTVPRSTPMMDLLVQIATAHKLSASSYTLQAIGERGLVLPHQPNTPIGALDALQVKLLPKQGTFVPRKAKQANQPFETTFRLQVLLPRNQLYVSRVSPKMNLGKILDEVCREKNLDKNKYELRHPANLEETLDLSLSLQDYHLQEVTLYAKQGRALGAALSSQDIMALQRQEERRRQQAKQSVFGFMFRKSKESSLSIDSLGGRSVSPARSDETGRSVSPLAPPPRPLRKRRPAPKPPVRSSISGGENDDESNEKLVISHSRNSSDSSGYHEASVLSDNPDSNARIPETLPRRSKPPCKTEMSRKLAQTSQASKSLGNLAVASGGLSHGISSSSISSTGVRKKRAAPPPPIPRPLSSAISTQALERIVDSEESLTSDIDISKSPSDIAASSKANSDIGVSSKANSDIGVHSLGSKPSSEIGYKIDAEFRAALADHEDSENERNSGPEMAQISNRLKPSLEICESVENPRIAKRETKAPIPTPKPRSVVRACEVSLSPAPRSKIIGSNSIDSMPNETIEVSMEIIGCEKMEKIEPEKRMKSSWSLDSDEREKSNDATMRLDREEFSKNGVLKHVKSLDDIWALSREFPDNISELDSSCAIISTIPKCAHLSLNFETNFDELDVEKKRANGQEKIEQKEIEPAKTNHPMIRKRNIFRSQSALEDFEINSLDKPVRHLSSHTQDFNCALNPNFSGSIVHLGSNENVCPNGTIQLDDNSSLQSQIDFPPFILQTTNLRCQEDQTQVVEIRDNWEPQIIEQSASTDRPTETDILLQKVSDTLSNSLPVPKLPPTLKISVPESPENVSIPATDESDGMIETCEIKRETNEVKSSSRITVKNTPHENVAILSTNLTSSPDATLNSQQDTSDYVSATGDDLSITDWEYQLPAPPSAFRDNISPDFDGYDTITLRSVEAFKESPPNSPKEGVKMEILEPPTSRSIVPCREIEKTDFTKIPGVPDVPEVASTLDRSEIVQIPNCTIAKDSNSAGNETSPKNQTPAMEFLEIERPTSPDATIQPNIPKSRPQTATESRNVAAELKKEIIIELSTKLENASLQQSTGKILENDPRRVTPVFSAPEIAPVDNTLSNFTITTYSRKKSLDIFEDESPKEKSELPKFTSFKTQEPDAKRNFESRTALNGAENQFSGEKTFGVRTESENGLGKADEEFKRPETKIHFSQHDSLLRNASFNKPNEKFTNVHRSKSYITLANNSKYREDVNLERDDRDGTAEPPQIFKSTSVTNLNQETPRNNEKFSQWRENILKRQEEPSKEKQLQSLEVLKNILPRLKSNQRPEEKVTDSTIDKDHSNHSGSKAVPELESTESKSIVLEPKAESEEAKPQKPRKETATTKRYTYAGPPAISLGSWSERPRVNVQLKMDTDYKFATSNNTFGGKTRVNLNTLTKSDSSNGRTSNGAASRDETIASENRLENVSKKSINDTTATGYKKPILSRIGSIETKQTEEAKNRNRELEDDVKIDTKPVNFRELSKTFGEEVCLRTKPKRHLQNRHSDYSATRPDIVQNLPINGQNCVWQTANKNALKHADSTSRQTLNGPTFATSQGSLKRYTSVVGIQSAQTNNRSSESYETIPRNFTSTTKINGLMPVVKGFKISTNEPKLADPSARGNGVSSNVPPPPPTMPIITGVTLKNSTARPKSMPVCSVDPRDQLLESIRNFGGRDRLKSSKS